MDSSRKLFAQKRSLLLIIGLIMVNIILAIAIGTQRSPKAPNDTIDTQQPKPTPTVQPRSTVTPTPTLILPQITTDWQLTLPKEEHKAEVSLAEKNILFALKKGKLVQVFKKNLQDGSQSKILEYTDYAEADSKSGNLWQGLPPSIALSPNKQFLAFTDNDGLKLYDLATSTQQKLLYIVTPPSDNSANGATWNLPQVQGTFSLGLPSWSGDGRYISFVEGHYEGGAYAAFDTVTHQYSNIADSWGSGISLPFSPIDATFIYPRDVIPFKGLYKGTLGTGSKLTNLAKVLGKEKARFASASFSPDGTQIVFTYQDGIGNSDSRLDTFNNLGLAKADGTNMHVLIKDVPMITPVFSPDDKQVFFIEQGKGQAVLAQYDIQTNKIVTKIGLSKDMKDWKKIGWTKEGYLTVQGKDAFLILDIANKQTIYSMPIGTHFITIAGLN